MGDDDGEERDKRGLLSPDVINRTVEFVEVCPSIHRWIRIRPIRLKEKQHFVQDKQNIT